MTTLPETTPQPRKSSADFVNWSTAPQNTLSQQDIDYWDMIRKRSADSISIGGMMPFVFTPNRMIGESSAETPWPGGVMPTAASLAQSINPGGTVPGSGTSSTSNYTGFDFTPQMQTDLLAALQTLVDKPGFEQLGPLLGLLGKG